VIESLFTLDTKYNITYTFQTWSMSNVEHMWNNRMWYVLISICLDCGLWNSVYNYKTLVIIKRIRELQIIELQISVQHMHLHHTYEIQLL